jgi:DNA-binding SARP family transcriptional activator
LGVLSDPRGGPSRCGSNRSNYVNLGRASSTATRERESVARRGRRALSEGPSRRSLFYRFPYGLALVDGAGRILELNARSAELLSVDRERIRAADATCCEVVCDRAPASREAGCFTRRALEIDEEATNEIQIDIDEGGGRRCVWVAATSVDKGRARVLLHLRPGPALERRGQAGPDRPPVPGLRIHALGGFRIEGPEGRIGGEWIKQRPGQLLKYLICERSRTVASEQIAEALWPNADQRKALTRVRQYVHQLRSSLEPDRGRSASAYVATRRGGYALADAWIDADEFESRAESGLDALAHGDIGRARDDLSAARDLYRGDFLAEDHFAEWALAERDRLRELASRALRPLVQIELESGRIEAAADRARELIGMEPFDVDVCRSYLRLCLRLGRRTEAVRQYSLLRKRMREFFGEELDFALADLAAAA